MENLRMASVLTSKCFYFTEICEMCLLTLILCPYVYSEPSYLKIYNHLHFLYFLLVGYKHLGLCYKIVI